MFLLSALSIFVFDTVKLYFMNSFLNQVVVDLNKRFGRDLSEKIYVFPNRRVGVFLAILRAGPYICNGKRRWRLPVTVNKQLP